VDVEKVGVDEDLRLSGTMKHNVFVSEKEKETYVCRIANMNV
jgi:hypothetical protein